jgi:hypothetical protein
MQQTWMTPTSIMRSGRSEAKPFQMLLKSAFKYWMFLCEKKLKEIGLKRTT